MSAPKPTGPALSHIDSDDLPPLPSRPWYIPPAPAWADSRTFVDDDPDRLRAAPLAEVASAFRALADLAHAHSDQNVREAGALLARWLDGDLGRRLDLATATGLKRSGNSLPEMDARAEILVLALAVARRKPYASLPPRDAAEKIRKDYALWVSAVWSDYADRLTAPAIEQPGQSWWRIRRFGIKHPLPTAQRLCSLIGIDRVQK